MEASTFTKMQFEVLFEHLLRPVCALNQSERLVFYNAAFGRLLDWKSQDSSAIFSEALKLKGLYGEDVSYLHSTIQSILNGKPRLEPLKIRFVNAKGTKRKIDVYLRSLQLNEETVCLCEFSEVTDQVALKSELRTSQSSLQLASEVAETGIFDYDIPSRKLIINPKLSALTGIAFSSDIDYAYRFFQFVESAHRSALLRIIATRRQQAGVAQYEFPFSHPQKGLIYLRVSAECLSDSLGRPKRIVGVLQDVTEKVKQHDAVLNDRDALQTILDAQRALIVRINTSGRILLTNKAFREMPFYTEVLVHGGNLLELLKDDDRRQFQARIEELATSSGLVEGFPLQWISRQGETISTEWDIIPIRSSNGDEIELQLFGKDTSVVDTLSREVEFTYSNLKSLINNFRNVSIWSVDTQLRLIAFNDHFKHEFEIFWGRSPTVGDEIYKVTRGDQPAILYWRALFERALKGEYFFIEHEMDGSFFEVAFNPIELNGQITGVACYGLDISRQKLTERRLRLNEERWQFAVEGNHYGFWDYDVERDSLFFSPTCYAMLGYLPGEGLSNSAYEYAKLVHPADYDFSMERFRQILSGEINEFNVEMRFLDNSGKYRWIQNKGKVFRATEEGKPLRVLGLWSDISQSKSAEQTIRRHMENLEKFASITSHELRHPAATIMGIVRQLEEPDLTEHDKQILMSKLSEASVTMDNVIREMNSLLRPTEATAVQPEQDPLHVNSSGVGRIWLIDDDVINNVLNERLFRKHFPAIQTTSFTRAEDALFQLTDDEENQPDLIFLDINMPGMNGWDLLNAMINHNFMVKVYMLSSSIDPKDYQKAGEYHQVADYIAKPLKEEHLHSILSGEGAKVSKH